MMVPAAPVVAVLITYGESGSSPGFCRIRCTHCVTTSITADLPDPAPPVIIRLEKTGPTFEGFADLRTSRAKATAL